MANKIRVEFWLSFRKKQNSTTIPGASLPTQNFDCYITDDCSVFRPIIKLQAPEMARYSYAYILTWNRYYFVSDWTYRDGFAYITLTEDVMGTYRDGINNLVAFVSRSNQRTNANIPDALFTSQAGGHSLESRIDNPFRYPDPYLGKSGYIIQYQGKDGIETAFLEPNMMERLCNTLWNSWEQIAGMTDLYAAVADPFQYITSVQKTPAARTFWNWAEPGTNPLKKITLGTVKTDVQGLILNTEGRTPIDVSTGKSKVRVFIPKHPQSGSYPWLKGEPYSKYSIRLPGIGWVNVPSGLLYNESYLYLTIRADPNSGDMMVEMKTQAGNTVATARGKITIPWGISTVSASATTMPRHLPATGAAIKETAKAIFSEASNPLDYISNVAQAMGTVAAGFTPNNVESNGAGGGIVGLTDDIILQLQYADMVPPDTTNAGGPFMQAIQIKNLSGYIQCAAGTFAKAPTPWENDAVNRMLTGGFYNEPITS